MTSYEPYLIEVDPADTEFRETRLKSVRPYENGDGWEVAGEDSWCLGIPKLTLTEYGDKALWTSPEPAVGDVFRVYGRLGRPVRGVTLNGVVVYYRTPELQEQHDRRWSEEYHAKNARREVVGRAERLANYERLVPVFKARIDRFRAEKPDFVRDDEGYEVFCLLQAQAIADHYRDRGGAEALKADRGEGFDGFGDLWDKLTKSGVVANSHSNNTFGAAVSFAEALLEGTYSEPEPAR